MITVTDRAARYLEAARADGELAYRDLRIVARRAAGGEVEYALHWIGPAQSLPGDLVAECGPIRVHFEIHSAAFLRDATLDYVYVDPHRSGFRLTAASP